MVEVTTFNQLFLQRLIYKLTIENINRNSDQWESCDDGQYNFLIDQNFDLCFQSLVFESWIKRCENNWSKVITSTIEI